MTKNLKVSLGEDSEGKLLDINLDSMLISGTIGSGKGVAIDQSIMSLMSQSTPYDLKFVMVDPKVVQFSQYRSNPYLLVDPITDMSVAYEMIAMLSREVDKRKSEGSISEPNIILVIEEYLDIFIQFRDIGERIVNIAHEGREVGIYVWIAMQTPCIDLMPPLIEESILTRWVLKQNDEWKSRMMMGESGAEKLSGHGDFIIKYPSGEIRKGQVPFISDGDMRDTLDELNKKYSCKPSEPIDNVNDVEVLLK